MKTSPRYPRSPLASVRFRLAVLVLMLGTFAGAARAVSRTWSATPADGNWSNGANWVGGAPPVSGDDLTFPATTTIHATTNDFASGFNFVSITFLGNGYTLSGNAIVLGELLCHSPGTSNEIAMAVTVNANIVLGANPGCATKFSGGISGTGGVNVTGGGPVTIDGSNSYTGETDVNGGFLIIDGSLTGTSKVKVFESGGNPTLAGHGSFTAPLTVDNSFPTDTATVAIGDGFNPGILSTGNVSFGATSTRTILTVKLNGTTPGTDYDQLHVSGNVNLAHAFLQVPLPQFVPANGTQFTIIKNDGGNAISGIFEGLAEGAQFSVYGYVFQITYSGGSGHDVVLTVLPTTVFPIALAVDTGGNGVLEKGELATVAPSWQNSGAGSVTVTGTMSLFTGPAQAGTVFDIPDPNGSYGTIPDPGAAICTDCYTVQITASNRPAQHWDTYVNENIAPFNLIKTWTLHIGESFGDVPTTHPFYQYIENLFHNGVTGGCAGGNYCPSNPVTRGQMAVFLLKGEHGTSYTPPACSSTMFTDVPCPGGPFVDWINILASENITGGCGNGQYCPGASVTRAQMAVFLLKGEQGGSYVPPTCAGTIFTDVPCPGGQFVDWINTLALEGITGGCGNGQYCPGNSVTRGQMAVFLTKAYFMLLYGP